jgi:hypothetical protein
LIGSGVAGDRVVGGYDPLFNGQAINFNDGESTELGDALASSSFCATILNLAGIDHQGFFPGVPSIPALLA